ncbi:vacuolar calcium ion transporter [Purpureocillium lavendulum]|uniref:Vacuolar calcium ion transporter n=1 Tax=Purpureocillium lavendulum TaxID=1247861 RepID=A0AB34FRK8_9HYPO|nr:vacuolar calcium ion transporter [Purpureocillium lavendulum]
MEATTSASLRCDAQANDISGAAAGDDGGDGDCPDGDDALLRFIETWASRVDSLCGSSETPEFEALHQFDSPDIVTEGYHGRLRIVAVYLGPLRDIIFSSWLNVLLVFLPVALLSVHVRQSPLFVFASNSIAIVPLSVLLTDATERIAAHAGDTIGALLNISLGNLVELILFVALRNNQVDIVRASILGSILVNMLLILGSALVAGSVLNCDPTYNTVEAQLLACLLFVSVFVFLMPTAFDYTFDPAKGTNAASLHMSRVSCILVLAIYIIYIIHELRSHSGHHDNGLHKDESDLESAHSAQDHHYGRPPQPMPHSVSGSQILPPRTIRFADEGPSGSALSHKPTVSRIELGTLQPHESESEDDPPADYLSRGRRMSRESSLNRGFSRSNLTTLHMLRDPHRQEREVSSDRESALSAQGQPQHSASAEVIVSIVVLGVSSALMSLCAEFLVGAIDEVTRQTSLSSSVIGLIILPIVGNVAEYVTVVAVATRDKLDLALAVAVGSAIQIALCVTPLTVLAGWALGKKLALVFNFFEMATLLGGVLLVNLLVLNDVGGSLRLSGLKGGLMCACYVIIG